MPNPTDIDTALYLLRDFLAEQKRMTGKGITLETVFNRTTEIQTRQNSQRAALDHMATDHIELSMRLDRYGKEIRKIKKTIREFDEEEENSEIIRLDEAKTAHDLSILKAKNEELHNEIVKGRDRRDSDITFFQRQRWLWLGMGILAVVTTLGSGCTGLIVWKITQSAAQSAQQGQAK